MGFVLRLVVIAFVILAAMTMLRTLLHRNWPSGKQQPSPGRDRVLASLNRGIAAVRRIAWAGLAVVLIYFAARAAAVHDWGFSHDKIASGSSQTTYSS